MGVGFTTLWLNQAGQQPTLIIIYLFSFFLIMKKKNIETPWINQTIQKDRIFKQNGHIVKNNKNNNNKKKKRERFMGID
jgi:hypothetical protein